MAGIYIHIPFCKQACHYCNFHFSTSLHYKDDMVTSLLYELEMRKPYLGDEVIDTVYLGGGTPSLLDTKEINDLMNSIWYHYKLSQKAEITLEANPDDLNEEKLEELKWSKINRLSIGIQSFSDKDLKFMNRAHNATEAETCIENARAAGFEDLTVDLIYGTPTMSDEQWKANIEKVLAMDIPHISCYCLTVEEKTALHKFVEMGKAPPVDDKKAAEQFKYLTNALYAHEYEHYEISNFAKPGQYSIHNSNYWKRKKYLGIGPGAHSFDGKSRQWNVANNIKYINAIRDEKLDFEREELTPTQQYNEYVLTSLRTMWGTKLSEVEKWGEKFSTHFTTNIQQHINDGKVVSDNGTYTLSRAGKLFADGIASDLFYVG